MTTTTVKGHELKGIHTSRTVPTHHRQKPQQSPTTFPDVCCATNWNLAYGNVKTVGYRVRQERRKADAHSDSDSEDMSRQEMEGKEDMSG